ncbi:MAG: GTPase ObgE [Ardenticatenaceae bacterium]|nr:GTPase ObgE [Anaerolineales bacterium]MCB8920077.1 GTPase ObgE [Ardenticatenaceae bacterium]
MFYDRAKIYVKSGDGGDGMIGFRREKFVPLGGPSGGDGGKGGDIVLTVNPSLNSLIYFHRKVHFRAGNGKHGGTANKTGANGDSLVLEVPPGTLVRNADSGELLADLTRDGQEVVILTGGRGGRGNARFASSVNQAPRIAERGEPGEEFWLELELKLIADVGIVGKPNAGKSTLLSVVSAAQPKIANYPFTTLQPNLGVVELDEFQTMVFADIPGLIEGASEGIGLGHDFLRHVERTRVLIHLLDGSALEPLEDWAMINQELAMYDVAMEKKPQLVVMNKLDLPDAVAWEPLLAEEIGKAGFPFCAISAVTGAGVRDMLFRVKKMLDEAPEPESPEEDLIVITVDTEDEGFTVEREEDGWRVRGKRIERIAAMTYFEFDATLLRFQQILEKMGITEALEEAGVSVGDTVYIGGEVLEWGE